MNSLKQVFEELAQQRIEFQRMAQVPRNLQHDLQAISGVLRIESAVGRWRLDAGADDMIGFDAAVGVVGAQAHDIRADLQPITFSQGCACRDARAVEPGAVAAADVLDEILTRLLQDLGVLPTDGERIEVDLDIGLPADDRTDPGQGKPLARLGALKNEE